MVHIGQTKALPRLKFVTCVESVCVAIPMGEMGPMSPSDRKIIANVPRFERYMETNGLDAIAVRTGVNFTYLSGIALPGTLTRHLDIASTVRGFMLVWPRNGEPIIVLD